MDRRDPGRFDRPYIESFVETHEIELNKQASAFLTGVDCLKTVTDYHDAANRQREKDLKIARANTGGGFSLADGSASPGGV